MRNTLFAAIGGVLILLASVKQTPAAATTLWVGNPGVTATTNWSDNANWNNGGPNQNSAVFGGTGSASDLNTVTSFLPANQAPLSLQYTNQSLSPSSQFHNTMIPAGVTLTVGNSALTIGGLTVDGYRTQVKMTGGGTLLVTNSLTIGNNGSSASDQQSSLDLSGLTNFVFNAPAGTVTMGSGNRSSANFTLANASNYVTAATWNANTASTSSGVSGSLTLGAGTNIINVNTFNVGHGRSTVTVNLPTAGGLRLRGTGGTDNDRVTMVLGNHATATGTGSTASGTLNFNGGSVDIKLATLTLGQSTSATTGGNPSNPGNGTVNFDTGIIDVTNINMAIANNTTFNSANGTITVGPNATLNVGAGGISMVNLSGSASSAIGTLNITGGVAVVSGNIRKTTASGTANININPGPTSPGLLTMNALTNTIGSSGTPIDSFGIADSTLTVPTFSASPSVAVNFLNVGGSTNTINITSVPGLGQFQVITYFSPMGGSYNFNLGSLPAGFQGYLSNNAGSLSVDVVITNTLAKTDTWVGNVSGNWNTVTANWLSSGVPAAFQTGDTVIFDDSLTGTANVVITNPVAPSQISVNNSSSNYVWSGSGKISGLTSLTKDGTASLTLSESGGDDFSGGITVNSGTLLLDNANGAIGGGLAISGGTVQIGNNDSNGALPGGSIANNGSLILAKANAFAIGTAISGSGSLSQIGSGTVTLSGANAYTGNTIVNNGVLALSGAGTISNSLQVQVSNATLDVSAIAQNLINALDLTNSSVTVSLNASGAAAITANAMAVGGPTNRINLTALPAIASYPVTLPVIKAFSLIDGTFNVGLGTLPVATPSYVGVITESVDQTTVLLTLTAGPVGTRPSVSWSGSDVPNLNTNWSDRLNWELPGAPTNGDTLFFGNNGSAVNSSLSTAGGGPSALFPDQINNVIDANFTISSLTYTNMTGVCHNTHVADGKTLNITNSAGLNIGSLNLDVGSTNSQFVNISGPQGAINVNNASAVVSVAMTSTSSGTHRATLDMSALGTFQANASRLAVGSLNTTSTRPLGTAYLAETNILTLSLTTAPGFTAQSDLRGLGVGNNSDSATTTARSFLYLGQTNRLNVNSVGLGVGKSAGTLQFNPALTAANSAPAVWIRGADGVSPVAWWTQGDALGQTGGSSAPSGTADFTGGTVNALVTTMYLGRAPDGANTGSSACSGTLSFDSGSISVGTLIAGYQPRAINDWGVGVVNVSSNATLGSGATLTVSGSLDLGFAAGGNGAGNTSGTLNITNGTALINTIVPGTNSLSAVNVIGGRLIVTNASGNLTGTIGSLTLASQDSAGTLLELSAPGLTVGSLNIDALDTTTNIINVGSVSNFISFPIELPLIQYFSMNFLSGSTFNIALGSLPPGFSGYLTNDTATAMVAVVITNVPPKPARITDFSVQSGNIVLSGTNGYAGTSYHVIASTNVTLPFSVWTRLATNTFDVNGNFSQSIPVDPTKPNRFFSIEVPPPQ
jgi:autotransporter-associated beta strand protein